MTLRQVLDVKTIKALAGDKVHRRGINYYRDGRVAVTDVSPDRVDAMVKGGRRYSVALWRQGSEPYWDCSCAAVRGPSDSTPS